MVTCVFFLFCVVGAAQDSWPNLQGNFHGPETMNNKCAPHIPPQPSPARSLCRPRSFSPPFSLRACTRSVGTEVQVAEASLSPAQQAQLSAMTKQQIAQDKAQLTQQQLHSRQYISQTKANMLQQALQQDQQCTQQCQQQAPGQRDSCMAQCKQQKEQLQQQAEQVAQQDYQKMDYQLQQESANMFSGLTSTDWQPMNK